MTVDRAHVLATPGMDRHSAYVGLSRHRDAVDLHYGRDDFADGQALARTLSRDRAKDMASDYARDSGERRGIIAPLQVEPTFVRDRAIQRHARAVVAIFQMQEGREVTSDQRRALNIVRAELDKTDPQASRDMERAYRGDPALAYEAAAGDLRRAVRAMRLEEELRVTAPARADAFVERWRQLDMCHLAPYQAGDIQGERSLRNSMGEMAKSLERDPQLESVLAIKKSAQLGIDGLGHERSLTRQLAMSIGFDLGRGRGLGV